MDSAFIIDDETAGKLAELLISRLSYTSYEYSFVLGGNVIRLKSHVKVKSGGMFERDDWEWKSIEFDTLKTLLIGYTLMEIKNAIGKSEHGYFHHDSINLQINFHENQNFVIKYLDDKITEIRFKKLSRENAELKESIKQLSDMFVGLVNVMEMNKGV